MKKSFIIIQFFAFLTASSNICKIILTDKLKTISFRLLYFVALITLLSSCGKTHFANNVMTDIGNGKYVSAGDGDFSTKGLEILLNDKIFSLADVYNYEAEQRTKISKFEKYFQTDVMFDSYKLVEKKHSNVDLLSISTSHKNDIEGLRENWRALKENCKTNDENFVLLNDSTYISTNYKNIDKYILKYKISTKQTNRIAYLTIVKIPNKGFRVTSFLLQ